MRRIVGAHDDGMSLRIPTDGRADVAALKTTPKGTIRR